MLGVISYKNTAGTGGEGEASKREKERERERESNGNATNAIIDELGQLTTNSLWRSNRPDLYFVYNR